MKNSEIEMQFDQFEGLRLRFRAVHVYNIIVRYCLPIQGYITVKKVLAQEPCVSQSVPLF